MWDINDIAAPESEAVQAEREIVEAIVANERPSLHEQLHAAAQRDADREGANYVRERNLAAGIGCDRCGADVELYHNDATGLSLCESCDLSTDVPVTWKRLRNGRWGVTGPSVLLVEGHEVAVTKRDGTTKVARVGRVLWSGDGRAIATVRR